MQTYDLSKPILTLKNLPILQNNLDKASFIPLVDAIMEALLATYRDEEGKLTAQDKVQRFLLAKKIMEKPEAVTLNAEEVVLIKKLVSKGCTVIVIGRVFEVLGEI